MDQIEKMLCSVVFGMASQKTNSWTVCSDCQPAASFPLPHCLCVPCPLAMVLVQVVYHPRSLHPLEAARAHHMRMLSG